MLNVLLKGLNVMNENNISFETALKRLEEIVKALESGNAPLDDAIKLFEEGVALTGHCNTLLKNAEQKVTMLVSDKETSQMTQQNFDTSNL